MNLIETWNINVNFNLIYSYSQVKIYKNNIFSSLEYF
jgi:hypothetical protein